MLVRSRFACLRCWEAGLAWPVRPEGVFGGRSASWRQACWSGLW
ncbi:hypothetical protein ACFPN7_39695 [Amycolatopsis halotolerans]